MAPLLLFGLLSLGVGGVVLSTRRASPPAPTPSPLPPANSAPAAAAAAAVQRVKQIGRRPDYLASLAPISSRAPAPPAPPANVQQIRAIMAAVRPIVDASGVRALSVDERVRLDAAIASLRVARGLFEANSLQALVRTNIARFGQ